MFLETFQNRLRSSSEPGSRNAVKQNRWYPVPVFVRTRNRVASCVRVDKVGGSDATTRSCLKLGNSSCCKMQVACKRGHGNVLA